ncbi:organoarsenical effux MFS transporter ArsJ [Thioalkalivibrio paradoxus]|uniref:MFS transporter permease n=1 Tax=Thioalkalivibrio paradoxus ARh 1 TaxID=713585 RepID=W0DLI0_9GAMM|nr:organoarsenical effux MFS transporter ArsJ [Thioalkalivibrio paradoxus]AHE97725.1 MFS transporter permease [Thioalkalivibrio paradoxus ARh 1]
MNPASLGLAAYARITANYWAFTITDGAIRMLVVLYFHQLGYSPLEIALLFLFYEFFGIVTNLAGGWLAARLGLNTTLISGTLLQIAALLMLTVPEAWLTVAYVMFAQALSGIAKDLNKMSAKSGVKLVAGDVQGRLFRWVAWLTGSKNALKGLGFFVGAVLLYTVGFRGALVALAALLVASLTLAALRLPRGLGRVGGKPRFTQMFANSPAINVLSAARFFLFGARDVWFVVALPVFLSATLGWNHLQVGAFLALWVIGYGLVQAAVPTLIARRGLDPTGLTARFWAMVLMLIPIGIVIALEAGLHPGAVLIIGLGVFGVVFAINSAVHSFLILDYADSDRVAMKVGFYYMANAGGRLVGTVLSGWIFMTHGLIGCLIASTAFVFAAWMLSAFLPRAHPAGTAP